MLASKGDDSLLLSSVAVVPKDETLVTAEALLDNVVASTDTVVSLLASTGVVSGWALVALPSSPLPERGKRQQSASKSQTVSFCVRSNRFCKNKMGGTSDMFYHIRPKSIIAFIKYPNSNIFRYTALAQTF